jgi:hypothetical protein
VQAQAQDLPQDRHHPRECLAQEQCARFFRRRLNLLRQVKKHVTEDAVAVGEGGAPGAAAVKSLRHYINK